MCPRHMPKILNIKALSTRMKEYSQALTKRQLGHSKCWSRISLREDQQEGAGHSRATSSFFCHKYRAFMNLYGCKNMIIKNFNTHEILDESSLSADMLCLCHSTESFACVIKVLTLFPFHRWRKLPITGRDYIWAMPWFLLGSTPS